MDDGEYNDGPCDCLVKADALVEWNDSVERCTTKQRDEVAADRNQNERHVYMQDHGSSSGDGISDTKHSPGVIQVVFELIVEKAEYDDEDVQEDEAKEKPASPTLVNHPSIVFLLQSQTLR